MLAVPTSGLIRRILIAALVASTIAAASATAAVFSASAPGMPLAPTGDAGRLVELVQGQRSFVFVAKTGHVETVTVQGWPNSDGEHDLGGAMLVQTVFHHTGSVNFGEIPMTVEFALSG